MQHDLRSSLLKPSDNLSSALARTTRNGLGLALLTRQDGRLVGTVTDAEIRASLMNGVDLSSRVTRILNRRPAYSLTEASEQQILKIMAANRLRAIPVIASGRLAGIRSLGDFPNQRILRPIAVIMAGGRGKRLRPLTDKVPKPLLRVGNVSILERIIVNLARAGIEEVFISVNYKARVFERRLGNGRHFGVNLSYLRERSPLGTAGALAMLPDAPRGPVLVTNADILSRLDYARVIDYHWRHRGAATIAAIPYRTRIPYGVIRTAGARLKGIEEKPEISAQCSAGIYVFEPESLHLIHRGRPTQMPELLDMLCRSRKSVHVFPVLERWFDIGSPEDFQRVLLEFATGEEG